MSTRSTSTGKFAQVSALATHAERHLLAPSPILQSALTTSLSAGLPPMTISPLHGQHLAIQCQLMSAKTVLEIGTLGGYSTLWFASTGAHVTSIEINPKHRDVALSNIAAAGKDVEGRVEVVLGAALDVMPKLRREGRRFDFVFLDADWGEQWECFVEAVGLTRKGGAIYVDNVAREIFEEGEVGGGRETLVSRVGRMEGVKATLISTVSGSKKDPEEMVDGFLLAVVEYLCIDVSHRDSDVLMNGIKFTNKFRPQYPQAIEDAQKKHDISYNLQGHPGAPDVQPASGLPSGILSGNFGDTDLAALGDPNLAGDEENRQGAVLDAESHTNPAFANGFAMVCRKDGQECRQVVELNKTLIAKCSEAEAEKKAKLQFRTDWALRLISQIAEMLKTIDELDQMISNEGKPGWDRPAGFEAEAENIKKQRAQRQQLVSDPEPAA
ncbi:S-adenosyl-L-methionine-dependent methyltransferase [Cadophora sp. MPI-SDFR-AT-0126]|nr:S-adenosyl-L-methionine-dependent methyltransferase [Leotiomycetes sp. MPI-SDFR-AT-0126]